MDINLDPADQALILEGLARARHLRGRTAGRRDSILVWPDLAGLEAVFPDYDIVRPDRPAPNVSAAVVAGHSIPNEVVAAFPGLKLVACIGVGMEGIDLDFLKGRGITVTNGAGINHEDVADVALGLLIGVVRGFPRGQRILAAGEWEKWSLAVPPQRRLRGMKLGIVGMGAIGQAIAARGQACGLAIAWHGPHPKPDLPYCYHSGLIELATWSDILAVAARADRNTHHIVDASVLQALGKRGILINISRGSVVDEEALIGALRSGTLWGAGLDVFDPEPTAPDRWNGLPNVMLTPHLGGGTLESLVGSLVNILENLERHFSGQPLATPVSQ